MASTQSASDYYNRKRASQTKGSIPDGVDIMRAQQIHSELKKNLDSRLTQYKLNYTGFKFPHRVWTLYMLICSTLKNFRNYPTKFSSLDMENH